MNYLHAMFTYGINVFDMPVGIDASFGEFADMMGSLNRYIQSIKARDPAPRSSFEILLYPGVWALAFHRFAHWLFMGRMFFLARFVNHFSRLLTAIDIHPGAKIGKNFFIDHGFVVIGETAQIGDNVTIYQGATLGGTNPTDGMGGKRHPTISDNVIISLGAAILGPIKVGEGARIGANAVVTKEVPAGATMVGIPARSTLVEVKPETRDFVPYGTPCSERFDPATQTLEILQCEIETLQARLATLMAEQGDEPAGKKVAKIAAKKPAKPSKAAKSKPKSRKPKSSVKPATKGKAAKASGSSKPAKGRKSA